MGQQFLHFWENNSDFIFELAKKLVLAIVILVIGIILSKAAQSLVKKTNSKILPADGIIKPLFRALIKYGILIICCLMILNIFGVDTTSILAVLGVAGIAAGLALKDILGNLVSGIILIVMGSIRIGEYIEFTDFAGTVKEIHLLKTILETPDGIYISAPNSCICGNPVKNYTRNGKRRMELSIGIAYSDSVDTAFQVMQNIVNDEPRFLKNPAPQIIMHAVEENSVKITLRAWAVIQDYWDIYWKMNKSIKTKIEEAGLHIPLPQRNLTIVKSETVKEEI